MLYFRYSQDRGHANFGWLDTWHSFSFGSYFDPSHHCFSVLRVINDDTIQPGGCFDTHSHRDMEIITYVLEGTVQHEDSLGNQYQIPAGEIQVMSAGTGVTHSEANPSESDPLRLLQIWIKPKRKGLPPSYDQQPVAQQGQLTILASGYGRKGTLHINQDASISRLVLHINEVFKPDTTKRAGYLHVIEGSLKFAEYHLTAGDGVGLFQENMSFQATSAVTALWFDLPSS